jgi:magnesium-transporting ATPase (P-type)
MPLNKGECRQTLNLLKDCNYMDGLLRLLVTDGTTGIIGSETDISRRKKIFGENKVTLPTITSFLDQFAKQFEDGNIILLIIAATVYLALSMFAS